MNRIATLPLQDSKITHLINRECFDSFSSPDTLLACYYLLHDWLDNDKLIYELHQIIKSNIPTIDNVFNREEVIVDEFSKKIEERMNEINIPNLSTEKVNVREIADKIISVTK